MLKEAVLVLAVIQVAESVTIGATCDTTTNLCTDANNVCDTGNTDKCICSTGYTDSDGDASNTAGTCQADLGTTCTQDSDCTAQTTNAACRSTCQCAYGYYDTDGSSTAGGSCTRGIVIGGDCSGVTAAVRNDACAAGTANSECTGTSGSETCSCVGSQDGNSCSTGSRGVDVSILTVVALFILSFMRP